MIEPTSIIEIADAQDGIQGTPCDRIESLLEVELKDDR